MTIDILHPDYHNGTNIVEDLDEDTLKRIGRTLCKGYEEDLGSRGEWEKRVEDYIKLAAQVVETKTYPWPKAANIKYPLLTTASLQFNARAYPALVPSHNIVRGRVVGKDKDGSKREVATRLGKFMTYQLLFEMQEWEDDMDKLCMVLPLIGTAFKKSYHDAVEGRNKSELVLPQDLVVNYYAKNLETATRKTQVLSLYPNELEELFRDGTFRRIELRPSEISTKPGHDDDVQGVSPPSEDDDKPYEILEVHCFLDLDEDGYKEPYIVTVYKDTDTVLRIVPRFDLEDVEVEGDDIIRIKPTEYYTGFVFIPDPQSGIYGMGFGTLLGPINETVNTVINQLLDAGHLSNLQGGFIAKGTRLKAGDGRFRPGEWKMAQTTGDDLRKNIVPLPVSPPSNVLFSLLGMLVQAGEKLASTTDVMTGELPGQNTKATTVMQAIEQGSKVFSSIYKRMYRSLTKEFKKLYKLNRLHLNSQQYFNVLDEENQEEVVFKRDFDEKVIDVIPVADPNVATEEQKLARVQALFEVMQLGAVNPKEVTRRYLEATNQPNIEQLMNMPQQGPSPEELQLQLEQMKVQLEHQRETAKIQIEAQRVEAQAIRDEANTALALAKAESEGKKANLELVKDATTRMKISTETALKLREQTMKTKEVTKKNDTE